jgi:hypothetical protein
MGFYRPDSVSHVVGGVRRRSDRGSANLRQLLISSLADLASSFARVQVFGLLKVSGHPKTLEETDAEVVAEVRCRYPLD